MKKSILLAILVVWAGIALAQGSQAVIIQNQSPSNYVFGKDPKMRIEVTMGQQAVKEVILRYRRYSEDASNVVYQKIYMKQPSPDSPLWEVYLPSDYIRDSDIQYYFEFKPSNIVVEIMSWDLEINGPLLITPGPMQGRLEEGFVLLSQDDEIDQSDGFVFAVSYFAISEEVDQGSIRVWVGGQDVTSQTIITDNTIIYRGKRNPGDVRGLVTAKINGRDIQSQTWKAKAIQKDYKLPVEFSGSVNFASNVYDYNIKNPGQSNILKAENDWASWGDASANYGRISAYTNLYVSSLENKDSQRINRYTLGFKTPFLEIAAGDYTPRISDLTMSNRNIYGLYGKLFSKNISLEMTAGEMVRKTLVTPEGETTPASATFRQEAIGARLRLGPESGFSIALNGARNRDIVSSLDRNVIGMIDPDTAEITYLTTPKDNLVASLDMRLNLPDQNVMVGLELAGSFYNSNTIDGPITSEEIAEYASTPIEIDPANLADFFVINRNMEPFLPSKNNIAGTAYYRTYFWNNLFNISYSLTGSAFNALSTYYQQKDTKILSISDQFFISRFLSVSGGFNMTDDNYSKTYAETLSSTSWFAQALFKYRRFPYLKAAFFNTDIKNKNNDEVQDAGQFTPFKTNAQSLSVGVGYDFEKIPIIPSQFDFTYKLNKDNKTQNESEDLLYENFNNSFNISMTNRLGLLPLKTQFAFTMASQERQMLDLTNPNLEIKDKNYSFFGKAEYSFFKNKLIPYMSYHRLNLVGDQEGQSYDYISLGLESNPIHHLSVNTSISQKYNRFELDNHKKNDSFTWRLLISERF